MNILFTSGFPIEPISGGVQRVTSVLAKEFKKLGHQVNYLILAKKKNDLNYDIPHHFLPTAGLSNKENIAFYFRLLEKLNIDVIVNQTGIYKKKVDFVCTAKEMKDIKIFSVHHNCISCLRENYKNILMGSKFGKLLKILDSNILWNLMLKRNKKKYGEYFTNSIEKSDKLVLLSDFYIDELKTFIDSWPFDKVVAIHNPLSFEIQNVDLDKKGNRLVYVGRVEYSQKQTNLLIPIWERVSRIHPDWKLDIVGDGSYLPQIKSEAKKRKLNNIYFHGYTDPRPFLEKAKIFLMTSSFEGYGMVIVEAQAYGAVPIAFDSFPILSFMFMDFKAGVGVRPFDVEKYSEKLINLMDDDTKRKEFVKFGKEAVKRFLPSEIALQWEALMLS